MSKVKAQEGHHITYHTKDKPTRCSCGWEPKEGEDTLEAAANHLKEN